MHNYCIVLVDILNVLVDILNVLIDFDLTS